LVHNSGHLPLAFACGASLPSPSHAGHYADRFALVNPLGKNFFSTWDIWLSYLWTGCGGVSLIGVIEELSWLVGWKMVIY
jgi:hypothetical protein